MTTEPYPGQALAAAPSREPRVAVVYAGAKTAMDDFARAMELARFRQHLPPAQETLLKVNISWQHYYPGCSTSPWQLDAVTRTLRSAGYDRLQAVQNGTVVVDSHQGEKGNKHDRVLASHAMRSVHL